MQLGIIFCSCEAAENGLDFEELLIVALMVLPVSALFSPVLLFTSAPHRELGVRVTGLRKAL
jgi:hypothetical protein